MSKHQPERKEKNCLNCGSEIYGRYCHVCGQENVEPHESFWHLALHAFEDMTHFDGKFFVTLKSLLLKPGFLSSQYIAGKRMRYLHPVRMYIFTSFIFFLIFFFVEKGSFRVNTDDSSSKEFYTKTELKNLKSAIESDTHLYNSYSSKLNDQKRAQSLQNIIDTLKDNDSVTLNFSSLGYNLKQYDSLQNSLPKEKQDNFFIRKLHQKASLLRSSDPNGNLRKNELQENFQHRLPPLLFISLPIFASLLLMLFYKRKDLYYVDHAIFSLHLFTAYFMFSLLMVFLSLLPDSSFLNWTYFAVFLLILFYTYKALRNFYRKSRWGTIIRLAALLFLHFWVLLILLVVFAIFLFFTV